MRASQCVERTLQYLRTFSTPWDYQSLELIYPISPNPFAQIYGPERIYESVLADNTEEVKKVSLWLKEFSNLKLPEKLSMIRKLEVLQGKHKVIKLLINKKALITISVMVGDWSDDVICLTILLLSTKGLLFYDF